MAQVLVTEQYLSDTADAIRSRLGGQDTYKPSEFADAINSIVDYATVTQTLTGASSSSSKTKAVKGESFTADITPDSGYRITEITVTMGGTDITSQVFKPGVGAKAITANGAYSAASDNLSGYDTVTVAVPLSAANLGTKSITANGTYAASSDSLDGYSEVTVNVSGGSTPTLQTKTKTYTPTTSTQTETVTADAGYDGLQSVGVTVDPIPSSYIIPAGTKSITANGTGIDVTEYASVDVAVPTSGAQMATGTYTPSQTYNTTGNRAICTLADIGFTPSRFILEMDDKANTEQTQYAVIRTSYELMGSAKSPLRITTRYSNATGSVSAASSTASWTTQTNYYLYTNGTTIYFRTTNVYLLPEGVTYKWTAYE